MSCKRTMCLLLSLFLISAVYIPASADETPPLIGVKFEAAEWSKYENIPVSLDAGQGNAAFGAGDEIQFEADVYLPQGIEDWLPDFMQLYIIGGVSGDPGRIHFAADNDFWLQAGAYLNAESVKDNALHCRYRTITDSFVLPGEDDPAMRASLEEGGLRFGIMSKYNQFTAGQPLCLYRIRIYNATKDRVLYEAKGGALSDYATAASAPVPLYDAVGPVVDQIAALAPVENLTLEDTARVEAARAAFNALSEDERTFVDNLALLSEAEEWIAGIMVIEPPTMEVDRVAGLIDALPDPADVTEAHRAQIEEADAAYQALPDESKALLTNVARLDAALQALAQLGEGDTPIGVQFTAIEWSKYEHIPVVRLDEEDVACFDPEDEILFEAKVWLPEGIDDWVPDLMQVSFFAGLEAKEDESGGAMHFTQDVETWLQAADYLEADAEQSFAPHYNFKLLTDNFYLPGEDDAAMAEAIEAGGMRIALMSKYNHLTGKPLYLYSFSVYNASKDIVLYEAAGEDLMRYAKAESEPSYLYDIIQPVVDEIAALPAVEDVTLEDKAQVEAARATVNALSEDDQSLIDNLATLVRLEAKLSQLVDGGSEDEEKAKQVADMIAALPEVEDITQEHRDAVEAALNAYNALTPAQKELVGDSAVKKLEAAKEKLSQPEPDILWGNLNGDSKVDASDALMVLQHSVKLIVLDEQQLLAADVNRDDKIDATDALNILQFSVKLIDQLPVA